MTPHPGGAATLRQVEVALNALLGGARRVRWGPELAGMGGDVWLPPDRLPLLAHLVRALHAASVASSPPAEAEAAAPAGWSEALLTLRLEVLLRGRFPGLGPTYDALRHVTLAAPGAEPTPGPGDLLLLRVASGGRVRVGLAEELEASVDRWVDRWERWVGGTPGPMPVPPLPAPARRLWNQAARRSPEDPGANRAEVPAQGGGGPGERAVRLPIPGLEVVLTASPLEAAAAPDAESRESSGPRAQPTPPPGGASAEPDSPTAWYDEWDAGRGAYRARWCAVHERAAAAMGADGGGPSGPAPAAVRAVRRAFERYRLADRWSRGEHDGPELDLEAAVAARAEAGGRGMAGDRLFRSRARPRPDAAVAVLVDLSDSVLGVFLQIEKEATLLLGAALEATGDPFALYGFHGRSRLGCELIRIKGFAEPYRSVPARVAGLRPSGYTRIAPALRHVTARLRDTRARHRLLFLITDGMPFDVEGYGGVYAVEDTRRAFIEARAQGVRPHCLDVDITANQYLARMCGPSGWTVVSEPRRLPAALLSLYGRARR